MSRWSKLIVCLMVVIAVMPSLVNAQGSLENTYTTDDGYLSFDFPRGWFPFDVRGGGGAVIMDTSTTLDAEILNPGSILITILGPRYLNSFYRDTGQELADYFDGLQTTFISRSSNDYQFGEAVEIEINGQPTLMAAGTATQGDLLLLVIESPTGRIVEFAVYAAGEADLHDPTILDIAATIVYTGPPVVEFVPTPDAASLFAENVVWQVVHAKDNSNAAGTELDVVADMVVDATETSLYVAGGTGGVMVFDVDGNVQGVLPAPLVEGIPANVVAIDIAADGTLWVADAQNYRLHHMDTNGTVLQTVGKSVTGTANGETGVFDGLGPRQLRIGADGNLYVINYDAGRVSRVMIFDANGVFLREFDLAVLDSSTGQDRFSIGPDGNLYFAVDKVTQSRIVVMDTAGQVLNEISLAEGEGGAPVEGALVVLEDGSLWATDSYHGILYHYAADGTILTAFGQGQRSNLTAPFGPGEFSRTTPDGLHGLVVLANGDLIVGDMNSFYAQLVRIRLDE